MTTREKKRAARLYVYRVSARLIAESIPAGSEWVYDHDLDLGHVEEAILALVDSLNRKASK